MSKLDNPERRRKLSWRMPYNVSCFGWPHCRCDHALSVFSNYLSMESTIMQGT